MRIKNLELIDKLCGCFENELLEMGDEAAQEMMRVIKAVAENRQCILISDGFVAPVLRSLFSKDSGLWRHVELQMFEGT